MYFVDRGQIEAKLNYLEKLSAFLQESDENIMSLTEQLALERAVHMSIEAILDVGNQMIDGFIMRDPGSYEDIIEIMQDEQVVPEDEAKQLIQLIQLRRQLVTDYTQVDGKQLWQGYKQAKEALRLFPERIRRYLNEHLGPVSAFLP